MKYLTEREEAMKLIETIVLKDGTIQDAYDNGTVVRHLPYDNRPEPIKEWEPPAISDTDKAIFEAQVNTEYLVALAELQ